MDEIMNQGGDILNFVLPKNQSSYIKVMGVGGGGSNAVNHMYRQGIQGVDFIVCNTDAQALESSPVPVKIQLGKGLGAGNVPQVAKDAALEKHDEIKDALSGTKMLFLTAGMGGGTGTGATPVVASIAKEIELVGDEVTRILTVAIVTTPFSFEGRKRIEQAKTGISELRKVVDAILVINNDQLRKLGKMTLMEAFAMADNVLTTAAKGISEIITVKSYVQIDFKDVNTVMHDSGVALMGFGTAMGENRAKEAAEAAMDSPLLNDNSIKGAKNLLLYLSYGPEAPLNMDEIEIITQSILQKTGPEADMIWGAGEDENLGENLNITLIATGFTENNALGLRSVTKIPLEEPENRQKKENQVNTVVRPIAESGVRREVPEMPAKSRKVAVLTLDIDETPVFVDEKNSEEHKEIQTELFASVSENGEEAVQQPAPVQEEPVFSIDSEVETWLNDIDVLGSVQGSGPVESSDSDFSANVRPEEEKGDVSSSGIGGFPLAEDPMWNGNRADEDGFVLENRTLSVRNAGMSSDSDPVQVVCEKTEESTIRESVKTTENIFQGRCEATVERMRRLREMAQKIRTLQGLQEVESVPAFKRQNLDVRPVVPSDVSEARYTNIERDGSLYSNPPFLSEKAD